VADVVIPFIGETVAQMSIVAWLKAVGDRVARDEAVVEITTEKIDFTVPAPIAGTLVEIRVPAGADVKAHQVVGVIAAS
jgi:2-oxoglutarate dehydrogenase E2 component (dihydrolipoamide succinyltransferase)